MATMREFAAEWIAPLLFLVSAGPLAGQSAPARVATPSDFKFFEPIKPPRPVQVMAHRGLSPQAPENTKAAIDMCVADGLEWAEVDVRLSKDGVHVLFHDASLDAKSDGRGLVSEQTASQLQALDAGSWFARRYSGTRMLTLQQGLALAKGRINLYLDCKAIEPAKLVREIVDAGMEPQVVVYDDAASILQVRELSGGKIAVMTKWHPADGLDSWIQRVQPAAVEIDANEVSQENCSAFHQRGIKVQAMTLGRDWDRPVIWKRVIESGVDWIQTDFPHEVLLQSMRSRKISMPVKISFHRGAMSHTPENTMAAIEKAIGMGADYVEVDLRTSRDGQFFLLHDGGLERTTSGKGPLKALDGEALARLDAGTWFGRPFAGARLPTVDEALAAMKGHCHGYLDAKDIPPDALLALMEKHQMIDQSVVYNGRAYLKKLKDLNPKVRLLPPLSNPAHLDPIADELAPYGVDTSWSILSKNLIDRCHARGILVFSDAMSGHETIEDYTRAIDWGIDVIQTNHPVRVWRAIELREERRRAR
jgi:glycerophosphoryl diester phosphodiesterase